MSKPFSQQEIILLLLQDGEWLKSYCFVREATRYGYLGTSGDRRARELAEKGQAERRRHNGQAEYRITQAGLKRLGLDEHLPEQQMLYKEAK